jgi:hypothetical protein
MGYAEVAVGAPAAKAPLRTNVPAGYAGGHSPPGLHAADAGGMRSDTAA